jgi:hypothetical protein
MGYRSLKRQNVLAIKRKLIVGVSLTELSERYNVTIANISFIADGKTWKKVTVPGWRKFLTARAVRRKKRNLNKSRKTLKLQRNQKKIASHRKKKTVKLRAAPKRPDYDKWNDQFSEPKTCRHNWKRRLPSFKSFPKK